MGIHHQKNRLLSISSINYDNVIRIRCSLVILMLNIFLGRGPRKIKKVVIFIIGYSQHQHTHHSRLLINSYPRLPVQMQQLILLLYHRTCRPPPLRSCPRSATTTTRSSGTHRLECQQRTIATPSSVPDRSYSKVF